jgi:hypothetical protein
VAYPSNVLLKNCNKKATEMVMNGGVRNVTRVSFPSYRYFLVDDSDILLKIMYSDHTGQMWLSLFNNEAESLLGKSAMRWFS